MKISVFNSTRISEVMKSPIGNLKAYLDCDIVVVSQEGSSPDRRVENRNFFVSFNRDDVMAIVEVAQKAGWLDELEMVDGE